jgi:hypothetical protein
MEETESVQSKAYDLFCDAKNITENENLLMIYDNGENGFYTIKFDYETMLQSILSNNNYNLAEAIIELSEALKLAEPNLQQFAKRIKKQLKP